MTVVLVVCRWKHVHWPLSVSQKRQWEMPNVESNCLGVFIFYSSCKTEKNKTEEKNLNVKCLPKSNTNSMKVNWMSSNKYLLPEFPLEPSWWGWRLLDGCLISVNQSLADVMMETGCGSTCSEVLTQSPKKSNSWLNFIQYVQHNLEKLFCFFAKNRFNFRKGFACGSSQVNCIWD